MNDIYMDNAATTKPYPEVLDAMLPYLTTEYGNASSVHQLGHNASLAVSKAREQIADLIDCSPTEVYFTSGATESNNWAVNIFREYCRENRYRYRIASTLTEHDSVINPIAYLTKHGYKDVVIPVTDTGVVLTEDIKELTEQYDDIGMMSIMWANNEIGSINNIPAFVKAAHNNMILTHTDATQALPHIPLSFRLSEVDMLSASSHKLGGPKGAGVLVIKDRVDIKPFIHGGHQENGMRGGTYNVPAIVGFGEAARITKERLQSNFTTLSFLKGYFIGKLKITEPDCRINTPLNSLPNIVSVSFMNVSGEDIVTLLSQNKIYCSAGSACNSGTKEPSRVLRAINVPSDYIYGTVRFSLSEFNTTDEIDYVCSKLKEILLTLRRM